MPLAHFTNVATARDKDEVIHKNLFEVTIVLPTIVAQIHAGTKDPNIQTLLLENIKTAKFPTYPDLPEITQKFKYSTRKFLGMPDSTSFSPEFSLNLNQNITYQVFCWRVLKDWYDLSWNNEDGSLHYKRNCVGDIIVHNHDKEGHIIRRVVYHNCICSQVSGWEDLAWDGNTDVFEMSAKFVSDYWEDYYY